MTPLPQTPSLEVTSSSAHAIVQKINTTLSEDQLKSKMKMFSKQENPEPAQQPLCSLCATAESFTRGCHYVCTTAQVNTFPFECSRVPRQTDRLTETQATAYRITFSLEQVDYRPHCSQRVQCPWGSTPHSCPKGGGNVHIFT